jgi:hypothetical protein
VQPVVAAPSPDYVWVPGCWVWHHDRYAWRPGYWVRTQPGWVWIPAHYVWAPRGYVFIDGYWDYVPVRRGVVFAPVYFEPALVARPAIRYSPAIVINVAVLTDTLFVRPHYHHYYFGDYYAAGYASKGFYASFAFHTRHVGYDPIYAHHHWEHRHDRDWGRRVQAEFEYRSQHAEARPPRTLAALQGRLAGEPGAEKSQDRYKDKGVDMAVSLASLVKSRQPAMAFRPVDGQEKQTNTQREREVRRFGDERRKREAAAPGVPLGRLPQKPEGSGKPEKLKPAKVRLPRSPIVAPPVNEPGKGQAPPKIPEAPRPDPKVAPEPTKANTDAGRPKAGPKSTKDDSKRKAKERSEDKDKNR